MPVDIYIVTDAVDMANMVLVKSQQSNKYITMNRLKRSTTWLIQLCFNPISDELRLNSG